MSMPRTVVRVVKIILEAGKANPGRPVGPTLAPYGVNLMAFCKEYNEKTAGKKGIYPAKVTVYSDRTFQLSVLTPPTAVLLREAAMVSKGASKPNQIIGRVTKDQVRKIAEIKMNETNAISLDGAIRMVEGTARSMGIQVE